MNKRRLILYFGLAGALPVIFFKGRGLVLGTDMPEDIYYFINLAKNFVISYGITAAVSSAVILLPLSWFEKVLPWNRGIWRRFFADLLVTPIVAVIGMTIVYYSLSWTGITNLDKPKTIGDYLEIALIMNLILVTFYEGIYLFGQWKDSLVKAERLEKENMITRFEALKNQVNPHFLFNSLNTLSSLIHEDVQKSEEFIDEFSRIYRYILERQDKMVSSVQEELQFIRSFFHLLKIRFGDALITDIKVDQGKLNHFIPTLSLQLLVENAIKHNKVTKKDPLTIRVGIEEDYLIVANNYQPRSEVGTSTKIGLNNLNERYAILCDVLKPEFYVNGEEYVAKIPLIEME